MTIEVGPRRIATGHPALAGHFPGDPLVPGVLILEEVFAAVVTAFGPGQLIAVHWVKFLAPLRPDQDFRVAVTSMGGGRIGFVCRSDGGVLARGQLQLADEPATA